MDLNLKNKVAIVTGASRGLGYACAEALAEEGALVSICSTSNSRIKSAAADISARTHSTVIGIAADLTVADDLERLVSTTEQELGGVDILVMSTAHPPTKEFFKATENDWIIGESVILKPAIKMTDLLLPSMRSKRNGKIIFIGSVFGIEPEAASVIQSTYRTALNALAKCISNSVAKDGICVNVVCPGYFDTPLLQELATNLSKQDISPEEILNGWMDATPAHSFGNPKHLGALVAFLSSPLANFITGTAITIDGGLVRTY